MLEKSRLSKHKFIFSGKSNLLPSDTAIGSLMRNCIILYCLANLDIIVLRSGITSCNVTGAGADYDKPVL